MGAPDFSMQLTHAGNDPSLAYAVAYMGLPPQASLMALQLNRDVTGADAMLLVPPERETDALAVELRGQFADGGVSLDDNAVIRIITRGSTTFLPAAFVPAGSNIAMPSDARAILALGPSSLAYYKYSHLVLSRSQLVLTNTPLAWIPPSLSSSSSSHQRTPPLACNGRYDARGRCVILIDPQHPLFSLATSKSAAPRGFEPLNAIRTLILDWDQPSGSLPSWLVVRFVRDSSIQGLVWSFDTSASYVAMPSDISDGTTGMVTSSPVYFSSDTNNDTIVLGRRALSRLITSAVYDSSTDAWTFTVATELSMVWRVIFAISMIIQLAMIGFHFEGPYTMAFHDLMSKPAAVSVRVFDPAPSNRREYVFMVGASLISWFVLISATTLCGAGPGADPELTGYFRRLGVVSISIAAAQFVLAIAVGWFVARQRSVLAPSFIATLGIGFHGTYGKSLILGLLVGMLPLGTFSRIFLVTATIAGLFAMSSLAYTGFNLGISLLAFWRRQDATARFLLLSIVLIELASVALLAYGLISYLVAPTIERFNSLYDQVQVSSAAICMVLLPVLVAACITMYQVYRTKQM